MSLKNEAKHASRDELEKLIDKAIKKVEGSKESDVCKYLPGEGGGYMHHFTLRKLKHANPQRLFELLQKFIVEKGSPKALDPKPRAPRGTRTKREFMSFTRTDIEKVLELARKVGDQDLVARFSPRRSLPSLKRELIRSIRQNRIQPELWSAYAEAIARIKTAVAEQE